MIKTAVKMSALLCEPPLDDQADNYSSASGVASKLVNGVGCSTSHLAKSVMTISQRWPLQFVIAIASTLALLVSLVLHAVLPTWRGHQAPLHSTIEALGGLCAIMMAIVLFQRSYDRPSRQIEGLGSGFLAMGVLEEFHAVSAPGNGFILLRSLASLLGSLGFLLVWLPESIGRRAHWRALPWMVAATSALIGFVILAFPGAVPAMMRNGEFSPTAVAPTSVACVCFLAAASRLFTVYRRSPTGDTYLFTCLALMFGLAELMFVYSRLWDASWWFWHLLRLVAYLLVLGYMISGYLRTVSDLRVALEQTRHAEESSRRSEQYLRQALEEREQMAQNLHDGIIQSLFALGLALERCRRLIVKDPNEVDHQLGMAIPGLKAVIRELRTYIVGQEPHIGNGRELEAALALEVRTVQSSHDLQMTLQMDPQAADLVTPNQAAHLLYIAREALSNSLRHANATHATLVLERHDGRARFVLEDDGVGFDLPTSSSGDGLKNMAARAAKLHAELNIVSKPGHGTRVMLELPQEPVHA
jgi:signal transduction histidine kinase